MRSNNPQKLVTSENFSQIPAKFWEVFTGTPYLQNFFVNLCRTLFPQGLSSMRKLSTPIVSHELWFTGLLLGPTTSIN